MDHLLENQSNDEKSVYLTENEERLAPAERLLPLVREAFELTDYGIIQGEIQELHPSDCADLLEFLTRDERARFVDVYGNDMHYETLTYLEGTVQEEVLERLEPEQLAEAFHDLDSDDALDIIEDLDEEEQERILAAISPVDRDSVRQSLSYPEESAGRLMAKEFVTVPIQWTVGQAIDYMRASRDLPDDFYDLYIVDQSFSPIGVLPVSRVMRSKRGVSLESIMSTDLHIISPDLNQEDLAYEFRQYNLTSAPVANAEGGMLGVVTLDDIVRVIDEEAEDDLFKMAGLKDEDLYSRAIETARSRFSWLTLNLGTAIMASLVIAIFDQTIERLVALAILMPIVASMGGNAGTQTLTVTVRAIAMKDLSSANAWRFIGKEFLVAAVNGVGFAVLASTLVVIWFNDLMLSVVIGLSMIGNLIVAGLAGALIPIVLDHYNIDPANASAVLLTTITDIIGFFTFLGLASLLLL
jgi:magnesium transporter